MSLPQGAVGGQLPLCACSVTRSRIDIFDVPGGHARPGAPQAAGAYILWGVLRYSNRLKQSCSTNDSSTGRASS